MNNLLQIKLPLASELNSQRPNGRDLRVENSTSVQKIDSLSEDLRAILRYYEANPKFVNNILIDVNYNDIIAKSNRISDLLKPRGININDVVVGARFSDAEEGKENHIITYYVDVETVLSTIKELEIIKNFINNKLSGEATAKNFNKANCKISYEGYGLSKSKIRNLIVDCSVVDSFSIPKVTNTSNNDTFLLTFYKTELSLTKLLEKLNISKIKYQYFFCGENSISVTRELFEVFEDKVPYLISMISSDLSRVVLNNTQQNASQEEIFIPNPTNEPTIGVIDTFFDGNVYFKNWVQNIDYLDEFEKSLFQEPQREHGTQVTSIIVDGPRLNPWLDDGCGRFKVRHFGICEDRISTVRLVRKIKEIVANNPDIHVWNLSLGTDDEVSKNFISFDAAALDEIQANKNVIFVVSGTNDNRNQKQNIIRVGSPADSLNSIIVNSVKRNEEPASYSRKGNILSFFNKPDVSYYGGDYNERIKTYSCNGITEVYGTSFAAPWISRKLCYLIDVMGIQREVAKALIIDAAADWAYQKIMHKFKDIIGYGIVPINIKDILATKNDEFKFVIYGTASAYKTTNYQIPIPKNENDKYPYIARATLCYFPQCTRSQGIDYTNRELSLKFGRVKDDGTIADINENIQDDSSSYVDERQSRLDFRKWENTKFISKILKKNQPLKSYRNRLWGLSIISKERLSSRMNQPLNFGIVVTLKEIYGVNRIQDFIKACRIRGLLVKELNIGNQIELYNINQENIIFD